MWACCRRSYSGLFVGNCTTCSAGASRQFLQGYWLWRRGLQRVQLASVLPSGFARTHYGQECENLPGEVASRVLPLHGTGLYIDPSRSIHSYKHAKHRGNCCPQRAMRRQLGWSSGVVLCRFLPVERLLTLVTIILPPFEYLQYWFSNSCTGHMCPLALKFLVIIRNITSTLRIRGTRSFHPQFPFEMSTYRRWLLTVRIRAPTI